MIRKTLTACGIVVAVIATSTGPVHATPTDTPQPKASDNPWLDMRVMNMAHGGGEMEAPTNTMYAFKRAAAIGSDMLELDVHGTADGQLVVLHNDSIDDTTNGTGAIKNMTVAEVKTFDAAYNFVPGIGTDPDHPDDAYPFRGVRDGDIAPPTGYTASDFTIPTLAEVFAQFPNTPINIEIKGDGDTATFVDNAELVSEFVNASGRTDIIVASFKGKALKRFHELSPNIGLSPAVGDIAAYYFFGIKPIEGTVALQIPVTLYGTIKIATPSFIAKAHRDGYAVHVWFSGTAPENAETYDSLVDACADALMPARPEFFEELLNARDVVRPGQPGWDPCV